MDKYVTDKTGPSTMPENNAAREAQTLLSMFKPTQTGASEKTATGSLDLGSMNDLYGGAAPSAPNADSRDRLAFTQDIADKLTLGFGINPFGDPQRRPGNPEGDQRRTKSPSDNEGPALTTRSGALIDYTYHRMSIKEI